MLPLGRASEALVVVSQTDPVATAVAEKWGPLPASDFHVDGAVVRRFPDGGPLLLRRAGPHIHDERLDLRLPREIAERAPVFVFPSIHRSAQNERALTVHPIGNTGPTSEVGGRPRTLVATDPWRMVRALERLAEEAGPLGRTVTYEATHHGPELGVPAFFVEIGYGELPGPPDEEVAILARVLPELRSTGGERVALAVGGGHYAPHFTDLALRRRWAFGHILSRHALATLDATTAQSAWERTPSAEGVVYARAADSLNPVVAGLGPRLKDAAALPREDRTSS